MGSYWIYGITLFCKVDELEDEQLKAVKGGLDEIMFSDSCEEINCFKRYSDWNVSFLYRRASLISEQQGKFLLELGIIKHVKVVDAVIDPNDILDIIL